MINWTFAALYPSDGLCAAPDYECTKSGVNRPGYKLTLQRYGRLLQRSGGELESRCGNINARSMGLPQDGTMLAEFAPRPSGSAATSWNTANAAKNLFKKRALRVPLTCRLAANG